ncbi:ABC transporter substrate-binding protein [Actinomyces radicidentis]|uniref:Prevent-host-death protein n=1 Tax=Actinomyces radicidentis TaxID=111015 RepID=A0A0X8JF70_ACTRD|nr:ABC transporter substrate-binding protein [Actinomyces radicidentis]AMD87729.1 prevent-host-death protein [Actinomyces radicidentis]
MRRRTMLLALPLPALLAACGSAEPARRREPSPTVAAPEGTSGSTTTATADAAKGVPTADGSFTLTDVAGRAISFAAQPSRIVLGESRHSYSLAFLNKTKPLDKVVAWGKDLQKAAPDFYDRLLTAAPEAADLPTIGSVQAGDLTVESLVAHRPDVILLGLDAYEAARSAGLTDQLDAQGLTYVVTDFRRDPARNTEISVRLIGALVDRRDEAERFVSYYHEQVDPVLAAAKKITDRSTTLLWRSPGVSDPCSTFAESNLGQIVTAAGGTNIADELLSGQEGVLTPEQVIASDPAVIIATGGQWGELKRKDTAATSYVHLGYEADAEAARASLDQLRDQPGFDRLSAFANKRVFGIYHQLYDAPYNFLAYLAFAAWQSPDAFKSLDPDAVWTDFHERFMPWKAQGVFAIGL